MKICTQYNNLLSTILEQGVWRNDPNRKETKRLQIPFANMTVDLREGFPVLTTKKMWWKGIVGETLWLLKGNPNIKRLVDQSINIWNKDCYNYWKKKFPGSSRNIQQWLKTNTLDLGVGRMYGVQWRNWKSSYTDEEGMEHIGSIDQLRNIIRSIKTNPLSSNHVIFGDNPADRDNQALPCCMNMMQFSCEPYDENDWDNIKPNGNYYLDLSINYRSWDVLLG